MGDPIKTPENHKRCTLDQIKSFAIIKAEFDAFALDVIRLDVFSNPDPGEHDLWASPVSFSSRSVGVMYATVDILAYDVRDRKAD